MGETIKESIKESIVKCSLDTCKSIFLQLGAYYKSAVIGGIVLLGLILGLWTWSYAQYRSGESEQDKHIQQLESVLQDIVIIRQDGQAILQNQHEIIKNQDDLERAVQRLISKY